MKKLIILSILLIGNSLLDACSTDETFGFKVDLTAVNNFTMTSYNTLDQGTSITVDNYAIELEGSSLKLMTFVWPTFGGNLMADISYALVNPVTNISITSNADLSSNYPAGSELKTLFTPLEIASHCIGNTGPSNDCEYDYFANSSINSLEQAFNEKMAVGFVERGGESGGARLFALNTTETIRSGSHRFTVRFDFQGGPSVELTTESVAFL